MSRGRTTPRSASSQEAHNRLGVPLWDDVLRCYTHRSGGERPVELLTPARLVSFRRPGGVCHPFAFSEQKGATMSMVRMIVGGVDTHAPDIRFGHDLDECTLRDESLIERCHCRQTLGDPSKPTNRSGVLHDPIVPPGFSECAIADMGVIRLRLPDGVTLLRPNQQPTASYPCIPGWRPWVPLCVPSYLAGTERVAATPICVQGSLTPTSENEDAM